MRLFTSAACVISFCLAFACGRNLVVPSPPVRSAALAEQLTQRVASMDRQAQWRWAITKMPILKEHQQRDIAVEIFRAFRKRTAHRKTLWVGANGTCIQVEGGWQDAGFSGRARVSVLHDRDTKTISYDRVEIGADGIAEFGPEGARYRRDRTGRWHKTGVFGFGSAESITTNHASEVRPAGLRYSGYAYTLTVECRRKISTEERCTDGTTRHCERCAGLWANRHAIGRGWATCETAPKVASDEPRNCALPCPREGMTPLIKPLNVAVRGRTFHGEDDEQHASVIGVYITKQACRQSQRRAPDDVTDAL